MTPTSITKRDGRVVPFDKRFILEALKKCFASINKHFTYLERYTDETITLIVQETPSVEQVQDLVQRVLMENREFEAATHYIEYRHTHKEARLTKPVPPDVKAAFDLSKKYFSNSRQEFQFYDKYSRFNHDLGRRETWPETVTRCMTFLRKLSNNLLSNEEYQELHEAVLTMQVMPSMRLLATAGPAAERNHACIYNCSYLPIDSLEAFAEVLLLSMSGVGVGYSVEKKYISKLPRVVPQTGQIKRLLVYDTTEEWVETVFGAICALFNGYDIEVDYSLVRPAGSILRTKGGRASGPDPLRNSIQFIRKIILSRQGDQLDSLEVHDIVCKLGDAAVQGGVRRTALICLFDINDKKMRDCKSMDLVHSGNTQRYNANNSAVWPDRQLTQMEVIDFMMDMFRSNNGEPGIFSRSVANRMKPDRRQPAEFGSNPCLTGDTLVLINKKTPMIGRHPKEWYSPAWVSVSDLVNKRFIALVKEGYYSSTDLGFYSSGIKPVYKITLRNGNSVKATDNHRFMCSGLWVEVQHLVIGMTMDVYDWFSGDTEQVMVVNINFIGEKEVFDCTIPDVHEFVVNGGFRSHNCGEINLRPYGFCNLSSAVLRSTDDIEDVVRKVKLASVLGTIQSMATDFKGLRNIWKINAEEERLLGVDLNGQADFGHDRLTYDLLKLLRHTAVQTNAVYAERLGINPSVAVTCVKPSGNSSEFLDCSSGLHCRWARYYIRRMRIGTTNPLSKVLKDSGIHFSPENGQTIDDCTTLVASFPVKSPGTAVTRNEFPALKQLDVWLKNKVCFTEHNPSVTITYKQSELLDIISWVYNHQSEIGGISFLPSDDALYSQMPYEEITKDRYNEMVAALPQIDFSKIYRYEQSDYTTASSTPACEGDKCARKK